MGNATFYNCDVTEFKQFNVTTPVSNYMEILADSHYSHCVVGTGSIPVGTIPIRMCSTTYYYPSHQAGPGGKVHDLKGTYAIDGFHWVPFICSCLQVGVVFVHLFMSLITLMSFQFNLS
ncbi:hypothetical protein CHARACLAT_030565 [Characodon lateralis]|uniref:Uncharacterized protein n=1 Tax=Characodon lateralis TaxID=208331 RepID=A0ABU7DL96_9TELE|nr:hypothetical protein [Characodon lateralis]